MTAFNINLARDRVLPVARRRMWYKMLILYLLLAGLLLVFLASSGTRSLIAASDRNQQLQRLEQQSLSSCAGFKDTDSYAVQAGTQMTRYADKLEAIAGVFSNQTQASVILSGLASPLSGEMTINSVELNGAKGEIVFEVWVPENGTVPDVTPPSLLSVWGRNQTLMAEVTQLTSVGSQHTQTGGRKFSIWRFTGHLVRKGELIWISARSEKAGPAS